MSGWCSGGVYNIITGAADDDPPAGQLIFYFMKGVAAVSVQSFFVCQNIVSFE